MPPIVSVSELKKESIIRLCNALLYKNSGISKITDLTSGEILYKIIQDTFPSICESFSSGECNSRYPKNYCNPPTQSNIFLDKIKRFIDDHYSIKSEDYISYENFTEELEIVKIAAFVLSEIVYHFIRTQNSQIATLCYTETEFQVELKDIFDCFIVNRDKLNKTELEELLSKSTKKPSPLATPRRTRLKEKWESPSTTSIEVCNDEIFSNSPLKNFFASPFQEKVILSKEKAKYEKMVDECDERERQLESENDSLKEKLQEMEKELVKMKIKYEDTEKDYHILMTNNELLKMEKKNVEMELTRTKNDVELLNMRIEQLNKSIEEVCETEKQEKPSTDESRKSLLASIVEKDDQIRLLKEKVNSLELKIHMYKKELSQKILTELKDKKSPGNINKSYEEIWDALHKNHKEEEEKISTVIIDDNRNLILKLNKAECQIQQLLKEIEKLKKKSERNKKSSQENRTCSIGSLSVASSVQDLLDTSKTSDTERFRKSFNQSKCDEHSHFSSESSFILNTSDNHIQNEQSVNFSKLEASPPSEKSTEAVLWKIYETQKSETESFYDISINHDIVISDSSNLNKVNELHRNNVNVRNVEADSLSNQENKCMLQILNVDPNLNRIKEITKNGSYEKLYQVLKRWSQERVNGTSNCNQLDLQEMLKVLTECLYIAMKSVNAINLQDKCCSTNENELRSVIQINDELNKLKIELNTAVQEHHIHLKECRKEKEELKEENIKLKNIYQISKHECEELKNKNKEKSLVIEQLKRKNFDTKKTYEKLLQHEKMETENLKNIISASEKKKYHYESLCKLLKKEINKLKEEAKLLKEKIKKLEQDNKKLEEKNEKLLNEKETQLIESTACKKQLENQITPNFFKKSDNISRLTQESINESMCSGAFQKSFSHYVSENEDDFTCPKPIIKENERIQEIRRRNSLYPKQLQSSYPLEADLNATYNSLYVLANEETKEPFNCKKRKLADVEGEMPSLFQSNLESVKTPVRKAKKKFVTPPSLRKLLNLKSKP